MYAIDENSGHSTRRGKRRSSILKIPKSPGCALDDIDPNLENVDENGQRLKKARRSSHRRVSFAETCQVKEIPNKAIENMSDENTHVSHGFLNRESTRDNSSYRPPSLSLAGLTSLLTSPIEESPQRPPFFEYPSVSGNCSQIDFTCCQPDENSKDNIDVTENDMEMTNKMLEAWEIEQSTVSTSHYNVKSSPEEDQLDFTHTHGAFVQDNQFSATDQQVGNMEMTKNYEGWEIEQSTVLARQVLSTKSTTQYVRSEPVPSQKRDATSFLNQLRNSSNNSSSFQQKLQTSELSDHAHSTTQAGRSRSFPQTRCEEFAKRDGTSFLNQLKSTKNTSSYQKQRRNLTKDDLTFKNTPPMSSSMKMPSERKEAVLDFTTCVGNGIHGEDKSSYVSFDEMDITGNYGNLQDQNTQQTCVAGRNDLILRNQQSSNKDHDLPLTRCHVTQDHDSVQDITGNEMEMTKNYQNWEQQQQSYMVPLKKSDDKFQHFTMKNDNLELTRCYSGNIETSQNLAVDKDVTAMEMTKNYENWQQKEDLVSNRANTQEICSNIPLENKRSPENDENLEFTRCHDGKIETSQSLAVDEDITGNGMEMTRNYENWEKQKDLRVSIMAETPKNCSNMHLKRKHSPVKDENLEFTRCQSGKIETYHQSLAVDQDVTENRMEITKNYENWNEEKTDEVLVSSSTIEDSEITKKTSTIRPEENLIVANSENSNILAHAAPLLDQEFSINLTQSGTTSEVETSPVLTSVSPSSEKKTSELPTQDVTSGHSGTSKSPISLIKPVPRVSSSRIATEINLSRFEIKLPTSRTGNFPIYKCEENISAIEPSTQRDVSIANQTVAVSGAEAMITNNEASGEDHVEDKAFGNENEVSPQTVDREEKMHSVSAMDLSTQPEPSKTTSQTQQIETIVVKEEETPEAIEPYTLRDFMSDVGISFLHHRTRRSETPMLKYNAPKELKDKIYSRALSEAKHQIMEDFAEQLQKEISANEEIYAAKEKHLSTHNPPVFAKLREVLETEKEDLLVEVIKQLKRTGETRGKRLWHIRKKEMRKNVFTSLQEQEKKLSFDSSLLSKHKDEISEDISALNEVDADCDKQIQELEATLDSEEKKWANFVEDYEKITQRIDALEFELKTKEEERARLSSVSELLACEEAELRATITNNESSVEELVHERELHESRADEVRRLLPVQRDIQEWILEKCDEKQSKYKFLNKTLDLDVIFVNERKIKDIQLSSQISDDSIPIAVLGHKMIMAKFAHYDFLAMFPTRKQLPKLLHEVSLACARVRLVLETTTDFSINHIMSVNDKVLSVEFSSLAKFMKFILRFDLSEVVSHGKMPFTVDRKIGKTSADEITDLLNNFPSTVMSLPKILEAADKAIR
ncbi:uncharacterized protein LOC114531537 isoform X2 [Dendronephthya gigantea]|uniref:uncharacterized protein LOC114531537 isoform X2 n=1 Tax=Dendronephthya gigantea TaxID=151771 RepID=UPI00106D7375|nr:uncharacterized protein LOC114531537 isoform X2 [Dendronephthya gigantea]